MVFPSSQSSPGSRMASPHKGPVGVAVGVAVGGPRVAVGGTAVGDGVAVGTSVGVGTGVGTSVAAGVGTWTAVGIGVGAWVGGAEIAVGTLVAVAGSLTEAVGLGGAASGVGLAAAVIAGSFPLHANRDKINQQTVNPVDSFTLPLVDLWRNAGALG